MRTEVKRNTRCVVSSKHGMHPNRVGYFQFYGEGKSDGVAVFTDKPVTARGQEGTYFAISMHDFVVAPEPEE